MHRMEIGIGVLLTFVPLIWPDLPMSFAWAGAVAGILITIWGVRGWLHERGKQMDWPQMLIAAGLLLAAAGLSWQVYRSTSLPSVNTATAQPASTAQRSLTLAQKDLLAEQLKKHGWEPETVWIRFESGCA